MSDMKRNWMDDENYQMILRLTHTVAFKFDPQTKEHFISPFVSEMLVGNYDGRQLSEVLIEDRVIYPEDFQKMREFSSYAHQGRPGSKTVLLRMKTVKGEYRWHRISICISAEKGEDHVEVVGTITDVDEEIKLRRTLERQAQYDEVTEIYNKAAFYEETERLLHQYPEREYTLVRFDINRFKVINELFGLLEGDELLRYIGKMVKEQVREGEAYGRIRDDVFGMCLCREKSGLLELLDRLRQLISNYPLSFNLSLSIGVYLIDEIDIPVSIMCDRASLAQQSVKGLAVGGYAFYNPGMGSRMAQEQQILGEMQEGIQTGQFKVFYQPKHQMDNGAAIGAEALIRWIHPEKGLVPPSQFIELFERNGLITQLDEYVWESVCKELRDWIDRGLDPLPVSVNVSRIHLYDPNLCSKFIRLTEKYRIPPYLLELELTESAYVENPYLVELMLTLQKKGFRFLMDDFGSGYSSLNMLRNIPVDILKLDLHFLGFTDEDHEEQSGKIIMESVIHMAKRLNMPVIVEGVETAGQVEFLRKAGCTMAQGYFYSKPMPSVEYEKKYLCKETKIGCD